jgi:hypothetical protein
VLSPGGDTAFYVEPQALESRGDGFLLVGRPTFSWRFDQEDKAQMLASNTFMGVDVRAGRSEPFHPPPGLTHVGWVRTLHLGDDRWGFLIGEYDQPSLAVGDLVRVLYAIRDGDMWGGVEELPVPQGGRLDFGSGGSLVLGLDGIEVWTTMHKRERGGIDVLLYRRAADGWRVAVVANDWVDAVDLTLTPEGSPFMALGGLDPAEDAVLSSIRTARVELGRATPSGEWNRLQVGAADQRMVSPVFVHGPAGADVAWLRSGPAASEAWVATQVLGSGGASPALLDSAAVLLLGVSPPPRGTGGTYLLTYHQVAPSGPDQLRVYRRLGDGYALVGELPYPFQGPFAAVQTATGDLLIVGPTSSLDPTNPFVRSLVIRMSVSCT